MKANSTNANKKKKKFVSAGTFNVNATFNNTIVTIADPQGDVIASYSAGAVGFKGARKSTPFAAQVAAEKALTKAKEYGLKTVNVKVKGPGSGRESAVRAIAAFDITVTSIKDITPVAHNGCRPPKRRRV
jgi:small subunit ribosomal protein S11